MVEQIWSISCAYNENTTGALLAVAHAVQFSEQLADNAIHNAAAVALIASLRCDRVELVEKDHARFCVSSSLKDTPHVRFGLSNIHIQQLGTFDGKEVEGKLRGDCLCEQGLAGAGRTVEENAASFLHALGEEFWPLER